MPSQSPPAISAAIEGLVDEAVVRRLVTHVGATLGPVFGKEGKQFLRKRVRGYNQAARFSPWIVLVDLDHDEQCAPPLQTAWLPSRSRNMCFRVAVRSVEAWLLADRDRLSAFLGVAVSLIPRQPEDELHPKQALVRVAMQSRRRDIRQDMSPRAGSGRVIGPAYTSRLIEFVSHRARGWRPEVAARSSESLRRCLACLRNLVARRSR